MDKSFKPNVTVGILGGMGPFATLAFYEKLLKLTPAQKDWNHLRIIIDNNPHIPSRSRAYLYDEESPVKEMIESCLKLQYYPTDFIVIPCNSAMYYLKDVRKQITVPILNIIEITSKRISNKIEKNSRIAVWGGIITYLEKLYRPYILKEGHKYIDHHKNDQKQIEYFIESIKIGQSIITTQLDVFIKKYINKYKPDAIVFGCTEFGCLPDLNSKYSNTVFIDSDTELASYIINNIYKTNL